MKPPKPTANQLRIKLGDALRVTKDDGSVHEGHAASDPWELGGHTWVVLVTGISGAYALHRCEVVGG